MGQRTLGDRESFEGYVTTFSAVAGRSASELEGRLGFSAGALKLGYCIYELAEPVAMPEFEWKDRTIYSGGWHLDPTINEYVQRQDELRAHLGKRHGYDESATDRAIDELMKAELAKLNMRVGPERIVKVVAKSRVAAYPDSMSRNIPQWRLKGPKRFALIHDVAPAKTSR